MCEARCTRWGMPDSLVPGTVGYHPNPRIFGNRLVGVGSVEAPLCVFRFTLESVGEDGLRKPCPRPARLTTSAHTQLRSRGGVFAILV
jgi:hypothetical protein